MDGYVPFEENFVGSDAVIDSPFGSSAANVYFATDYRESNKMQPFYPADTPWWASAATQGLSRAIDAAFGPKATDKSTLGATYAGANGRTYASSAGSGTILGLPTWLVLAAAVGGVFLLTDD